MVLLAVKPLSSYPEAVHIPDDEIHNGMFYERGITSHAEIIEAWDEHRDNLTAFRRWRMRLPRCPKCSHGSRARPMFIKDALRCRWGHVTTRLELQMK